MQTHPYFNLRLHEDDELSEFLGVRIEERVTIHEWPLSCVQRILLEDGRRLVYKASWGPTLEAKFYIRVESPLLVPAKVVYDQDDYVCLLIDWVDAPRLEDVSMPESKLLQVSRQLTEAVHNLPGDLPFCLDLRGDGWDSVVDQLVNALSSLCRQGEFQKVTLQTVESIETWCRLPELIASIKIDPGYAHGDLTGDNVLLAQDGCKVIDWQRPLYGPKGLDLVDLLESCGLDSIQYVDRNILRLRRLLSIHWLTQSAWKWFPEGRPTYDKQIAGIVAEMETWT